MTTTSEIRRLKREIEKLVHEIERWGAEDRNHHPGATELRQQLAEKRARLREIAGEK